MIITKINAKKVSKTNNNNNNFLWVNLTVEVHCLHVF
jgi:hypothetical protein